MRSGVKTFRRAKKLRGDLSLPEVVLWEWLRGGRLNGLRFRRQHPVGVYVLDFYCPAARLAIEIDGAHHDLPAQALRDRHRDAVLAESGIRTLRLGTDEVLNDRRLEDTLGTVSAAALERTHSTTPPPPPSAVPLPRFAGEDQASGTATTLDPPPFTGEGDHAQHGGGGVMERRRVRAPQDRSQESTPAPATEHPR